MSLRRKWYKGGRLIVSAMQRIRNFLSPREPVSADDHTRRAEKNRRDSI